MSTIIYALCATTSLLCATLLLRGFFKSRYRLLLWAGVCFVGVTINNALLVADKLIFQDVNFLTVRLSVALIAVFFLLYGLIFDE